MQALTIRDLEARIERRKAEWGLEGDDYVRANTGANRSEEKRELLRALAQNATDRGHQPAFEARY